MFFGFRNALGIDAEIFNDLRILPAVLFLSGFGGIVGPEPTVSGGNPGVSERTIVNDSDPWKKFSSFPPFTRDSADLT